MDKRSSFVGQLYRGEAQTKSWSVIVSGHVNVRLIEVESSPGEWKLAAFKKDKCVVQSFVDLSYLQVWECRLDPRLKFRVKNDFLQWQTKGGGGETVTYGIRLKDADSASQLSDRIGEVLNAMMSKAPEADEVQLKVLFSGREPTLLTVRNSTTMVQVLRMYCHKKQLETSQYIFALPPDSTHPPVKPSTLVGSLRTKEVQVVRKNLKSSASSSAAVATSPTVATDSNGLAANEQLLQVELPREERTVIRVSALMTMSDLLKYICEKRNLNVADHRFDLPATEESLASKTLEQLKITAIKVILREGAMKKTEEQNSHESENRSPSRSKRKSTKRNKIESGNDSPKTSSNRRQAPPPPPPLQSRRSQPNLIKELTVATERKATLKKVGHSLDSDSVTPPEGRHTLPTNESGTGSAPRVSADGDSSTDGSPDQERKGKVPLIPSMSRTALLPRSKPPPPPPGAAAAANKATPTSEIPHGGPTKPIPIPDSITSHKPVAPPPVAEKPKKKKAIIVDDHDEPDSAPLAPPTNYEQETNTAVATVDMDALLEGAESVEPATKKVKKKVKRKPSSEDSTSTGQKEKKTKSGKSTKKKKKVSHKDKDKTEEDVSREESVEREEDEGEQVSSPPLLQDTPEEGLPPPALLSSEEVQEKRQVNKEEIGQQQLPQVPATSAVKTLTPDFKRQALSLKRRPKGPAPRPPPLGPKTMTLGRIGRPVEGGGDVIVKGRGFTISATETENAQRISPSEEIRTKPRSSSEAPAPPSEKVAPQSTSTPPSQRGPRHRPTRKAPSRPAPSTPQGKEKTTRGDSGKSHDTKPKTSSSSGSPRRPPPTIPTAVPQAQSAASNNDEDSSDTSPATAVKVDRGERNSMRLSQEGEADREETDVGLSRETVDILTSKPPSTPPKSTISAQQPARKSPGQSTSGRRKDAATVICKDTEDGGKELIIKPSPNSKRKLAGPLIFKMPPPPSTPPNKAKTKKPAKTVMPERAPRRTEDEGSAAAAVENKESLTDAKETNRADTESADSSFSESISEKSGKMITSPKSLSDTLVSNEFTNLDELLSDSHQDIVTTDFSIEENLEPVDEYGELEWNESGIPDFDLGIPYQDPDVQMMTNIYDQHENAAAALNLNSNNNNSLGDGDDVTYYGDILPPPVIPPPPESDSDEWEQESNRTGELDFDSSSSAAELSKHSIDDGVVALDEEEGTGGVVLLNVKRMDEAVSDILLEEEVEQDVQEEWTGKTSQTTTSHLLPTSIPRDPSIGTQLNELDDVVSNLTELAAEVHVEAPPLLPPSPPPTAPPTTTTSSQLHPITSSTPTHDTSKHRSASPEPPPIPLSLPPPLTPSDEEEDDEFPLGPPPDPPSLSASPPSSPESERNNADNEILNRLKQRQLKPSSAWRRRRGSRDQEADGGESELLERLKERQTRYKPKVKVRYEDAETSSMSSMEQVPIPNPAHQADTGSHSKPTAPQLPGIGTGSGIGTGGDNMQLQLQFLQQQVMQQQMMQLQQQFQTLHSYALQQGVSMPANVGMPPGSAMMGQPAASGYMTTPMAPPTSAGLPQQVLMQTSTGQVLVPVASVPQMMHGQGVMPNPQAVPMMPQGQVQQLPITSIHGQGIAPNLTQQQQQQMLYGQGVAQTQLAHAPLMTTSVATDNVPPIGHLDAHVDQDTLPSRHGDQDTLPSRHGDQDMLPSRHGDQDMLPGHRGDQDTLSGRHGDQNTLPGRKSGDQDGKGTTTASTGSRVTPSKARISTKRRSEDVRAMVLGPLEEQFDSLMDQVRDANPTAVLKKVSEDAEEKEPSSSYTGMAAALAEALKQRRLHVTDKRRSIGELDESNCSDWQSP